jgi:recombination associated protein RdgC
MFFRNLTLFRFAFPLLGVANADALAERLLLMPLGALGAMELRSVGFVSPLGKDETDLVVTADGCALFALGSKEKLLPASVIRDELARREREMFDRTGKRVGGRERRRLKEEVVTKLMPQAFVREGRVCAYIDFATGWLVIDTPSRARAEEVVSTLRTAIGSFPCTPPAPEESPRALMTDWLAKGKTPSGFVLDDSAELRDPCEGGARVTCTHQDLDSDDVREHLRSGKQCFTLGLFYDDRITFRLTEGITLKSVKFLDNVLDDWRDKEFEHDADRDRDAFWLMQAELSRLLRSLDDLFHMPAHGNLKIDGGDAAPEMKARAAAAKLDQMVHEDGTTATLTGPKGEVLLKLGKTSPAVAAAKKFQKTLQDGSATVTVTNGVGRSRY